MAKTRRGALLLVLLLGACDYFPEHLLVADGSAGGDDLGFDDLSLSDQRMQDQRGDQSTVDQLLLDLGRDQASPPPPLFFDDFDDGTLGKWTLSGSGAPWQASTASPRQGSSHAATAKKTDAVSYMEVSFAAPQQGALVLSYHRLLVGLDGPDDFTAEYLDQGVWTTVEQLGSSSATDVSYVAKVFTLPNTATKVRFGCTCNAASESCNVESVSLRLK